MLADRRATAMIPAKDFARAKAWYADKLGLKLAEKTFTVDELRQADEIFLTGTQTEIMPIIKLDDAKVGNGTVGPVTKKLQDAFNAAIRG